MVWDAIRFLALGSAFTRVMTGNMVLFGIAAAHGDLTALGLTAAAIASFIIGAAIGARVAGTPAPGDNYRPAAISRAFAVELFLFALAQSRRERYGPLLQGGRTTCARRHRRPARRALRPSALRLRFVYGWLS